MPGMVGGQPIYFPQQQQYAQPQAGYGYQQQQMQQQPPAVPRRQGLPPPIKTRGVRPDDRETASANTVPQARMARSREVAIPSPEELGIRPAGGEGAPRRAAARAEELDWTTTRQHLRQIGVARFELTDLPRGGFRFSCWVPAAGGTKLVQGDGSTEADAVRTCLERARQHASFRR